jgi:hypothetical protein
MFWNKNRPPSLQQQEVTALQSIAASLATIATYLTQQGKPVALKVNFNPGVPETNLKGESKVSSTNTFSDPDVDSVPYDIEATDANGAAVPVSGGVLTLVSTDGNSVIVPNPSDPTGATGNVTAAKGYSGPVSGTATFTPTGAPSPSLTGSWTGTFTPGAPATLSVVFAPGVAPA